MKKMRMVWAFIVATTLAVHPIAMKTSVVRADENAGTIFNVQIKDYYNRSGKFLIYFNEIDDSKGYRVYLDDETTPVKTLKGSGDYLSASDLAEYDMGEHAVRIVSVNRNGSEGETASTTLTKTEKAGNFVDVPQVYIFTEGEITKEYHSSRDVVVSVVDAEGGDCEDIIDSSSNIKIRGNSTASADKKPWNIKFDAKRNVLNMGSGKKWCLLANAYDKSLMRNKIALDMGHEMGMEFTSDSRYVEVYINGVYNGNYLMAVPVEVKKERINIDAYNADSNDVLLELGTRYESDLVHFTTDVLKTTFDINDPEKDGDLTADELNMKVNNVKAFINDFETALQGGDYNEIVKYIDEQSFIDFYVASEYLKNADFNFSSTRFYIHNNKIYAGPLWDFDLSCGNLNPRTYTEYYGEDKDSSTGFHCRKMTWYAKLFETDWFENKVIKQFYQRQYMIQNLYMDESTEDLSITTMLKKYGESISRDSRSTHLLGAGWTLSAGGGYVGISYATTARWTQWNQPINHLRQWLKDRNKWMCETWEIDMADAYEKTNPSYEPPVPKASIEKMTTKKRGLTITLKDSEDISGYNIQYATKGSFKNAVTKTVTKTSDGKYTFSKLTKNKTYYVRARAFIVGKDKVSYSEWSKVKHKKVK